VVYLVADLANRLSLQRVAALLYLQLIVLAGISRKGISLSG
jgi:hypothetical protein